MPQSIYGFFLLWIKYSLVQFESLLDFLFFSIKKKCSSRILHEVHNTVDNTAWFTSSRLHQSCGVLCSPGRDGAVTCTLFMHPEERHNWGGWGFLDSKDQFHRGLKELVVKFWTKIPWEGFFEAGFMFGLKTCRVQTITAFHKYVLWRSNPVCFLRRVWKGCSGEPVQAVMGRKHHLSLT